MMHSFTYYISRCLSALGSVVPRRVSSGLWGVLQLLMKVTSGEFTQSVFGPELVTNWGDKEFGYSAIGHSGFKLHDILKKKKENKFVFVDVGANIGLYSIIAAENLKCQNVIAVEPNPPVFFYLQKNIERNQSTNVEAHHIGIAAANGTMTLSYRDGHRGRGNFLQQGDKKVDVAVRDYEFFDELYDQTPEISFFFKVDVEGFEPVVMQELNRSRLRRNVDALFIEISPKWVSSEDIECIFDIVHEMGLREVWRSSGKDQYDVYFERPQNYKIVEAERARLGAWSPENPGAPRYSICVSNYNMADTLERAMSSVAGQLSQKYEVVVIDDGSSDDSLDVLQQLSERYDNFRYISLPRDKNRNLGETRNISIRAARGEYVLLHIDADDVWEPFIEEYVSLYHRLEAAVGHEFLLTGPQLGMSKRDFLSSLGPYENIYRCEDRNLMFRLASMNKILYMDYRAFRQRLVRPRKIQFFKSIRDVWSHTMYDMRLEKSKKRYIWTALTDPIFGGQFSFNLTMMRAAIVLPCYVLSRFKEPIPIVMSWEDFMEHRSKNRGTYSELMEKLGASEDISFLSDEAKKIFTHKLSSTGFRSD